MIVAVTLTDLQHDGCGWSANGAIMRRWTVEVPDAASDLAVSRAVLRSTGDPPRAWARDEWAGAELGSWRSGTLGLWAEVSE